MSSLCRGRDTVVTSGRASVGRDGLTVGAVARGQICRSRIPLPGDPHQGVPGGEGPFEKSIPEFIKSEHQEGEAAIQQGQEEGRRGPERAREGFTVASKYIGTKWQSRQLIAQLLGRSSGCRGRCIIERHRATCRPRNTSTKRPGLTILLPMLPTGNLPGVNEEPENKGLCYGNI